MLGFLPYIVALSTHVRLDENVVIDKPTYGDTDDDVEHIKSYGSYAILTLPWYQQHCAMQADIYRHRNSIDTMKFPFDITSIIQYQIGIGQLHWQKVMKKTPFRYRFIKGNAALDRHIQFRWKNDARSMSEIGLQHRSRRKYAIMISFRYHYLYVGST